METLKEKTAKGLFWGALNGGTMQLLNVIFGIVLARILSPADYAIVGVLAIFPRLQTICRAVVLKKRWSTSSTRHTTITILSFGSILQRAALFMLFCSWQRRSLPAFTMSLV